jgi:hypothetical protein
VLHSRWTPPSRAKEAKERAYCHDYGFGARDPVTTRSLQNEATQEFGSVGVWIVPKGITEFYENPLVHLQRRVGQSTVPTHPRMELSEKWP